MSRPVKKTVLLFLRRHDGSLGFAVVAFELRIVWMQRAANRLQRLAGNCQRREVDAGLEALTLSSRTSVATSLARVDERIFATAKTLIARHLSIVATALRLQCATPFQPSISLLPCVPCV